MAERALAPLLEGGAFFECPRWRDPDGTVNVHADLGEFTDTSLNDMVVDSQGRAWIGFVDEIRTPEGFGCFACALGGDDGRTLLVCGAPDFLEANRRDAREGVLFTTTVDVPHAGLP